MADHHYSLNEERACLTMAGPDARRFLQGMVSNDVEKVNTGRAIYAGFLTAQGRFLHDLFVAELPDGSLALEGEAARLDDLRRRLTLYKLRAQVAIADARPTLATAVLWGDDAIPALDLPPEPGAARTLDGGKVFVDPRLAALGARAILPRATAPATLAAAGFEAASLTAYHKRRLILGVPEGSRDMPVEKALLLENGFEELNGVDFKKGCYVGQELTARMKYRALVKKRLVPVEVDGPAPAPNAPIMLGDQDVGEVREVIDGIGLALLKLEAVASARDAALPLMAGGATLRPRKPAWLAD